MRFKYCHGITDPPIPFDIEVKAVPGHIRQIFRKMQRAEQERKILHGDVKPPITATVGSTRFVAVGNTLHFNQDWKLFTDFLTAYLASKLGNEWGAREVIKPDQDQHQAVYWYNQHALQSQSLPKREDGLLHSTLGCSHAWLRLAYDIYLINHNAELQVKLLRRLRDRNSFQGARFEAAVSAMMLAAGYELEYDPEKGPGKHPEFTAKNMESGQIISVEAKSKHWPGIVGFPGEIKHKRENKFSIKRLLADAVDKDTATPLMVFIEVNSELTPDRNVDASFFEELAESWKAVQIKEWPRGFPAIGVIFYNDTAPWHLGTQLPEHNSIWAFGIAAKQHRHQFDAWPLITTILGASMQRSKIPTFFPTQAE